MGSRKVYFKDYNEGILNVTREKLSQRVNSILDNYNYLVSDCDSCMKKFRVDEIEFLKSLKISGIRLMDVESYLKAKTYSYNDGGVLYLKISKLEMIDLVCLIEFLRRDRYDVLL